MKKRLLRDIEVSAVGVGCMGFSHGYGAGPDRDEAIRLIRHASSAAAPTSTRPKVMETGITKCWSAKPLKPVRDEVVPPSSGQRKQRAEQNHREARPRPPGSVVEAARHRSRRAVSCIG